MDTVAPSIARMPSFVLREGTGRLLVEILEGRSLAAKDITGYSVIFLKFYFILFFFIYYSLFTLIIYYRFDDYLYPYCVLRVGNQSTKSNIKEQTLDPGTFILNIILNPTIIYFYYYILFLFFILVWNEEFSFEVSRQVTFFTVEVHKQNYFIYKYK